MPSVNSKPKPLGGRKQKNLCKAHEKSGCEVCGSAILAALIKAGESVRVVGETVCVHFSAIYVERSLQYQGRGLHLNSVVDYSIRTNGWDYNRRSTMRLIEKPWTVEAW